MIDFERELHELSELYYSIEYQLERLNYSLEHDSRWDSGEIVLPGELIQKLLNVDHRIERLGSDWKAAEAAGLNLTARDREVVARRARQLQARAKQLLDLSQKNEKLLKQHQQAARKSLQEVRRGTQFLESARGYRENYPKFIDTRD